VATYSGKIGEELEIDLRCIRPIFPEHPTTFPSKLDAHIHFNNYSKIFHWLRSPFEVPALCVHCDLTAFAE